MFRETTGNLKLHPATTQLSLAGTITVDLSTGTIYIHDGKTVGGNPLTATISQSIRIGVTGNRPGSPVPGATYFDTTLGIPIWYNGTAWVNSIGVSV